MAEIFGSFGRVISGNTLGSSIGSLARQILSDKIARIYQAFKDETTYEGSLIDATTAIAKLQALLANVNPEGQAAKDIQEYIDLIRQENRTRIINKAVNALALQDAGTRDYGALIKTMQSVLSDPTITDSEKQQIQAAIATQVRNAVQNAMNQFNDGGSITWNGSTLNFDLGVGGDALTSMISDLQSQFPSMQQELGKSLDIARAAVIIKKAEFAFSALDTTKDSVNIKGTKDMIKAYEEAYNLLKNSQYDLSQSTEALNALQAVQDYKSRLDTLEKNAAAKYAQTYLNNGVDKAQSYWNTIDALGTKFLGATKASYTGKGGVWDVAANGDVNALYDMVDALIAQNGGNTTFTIDGKTISLSRDQLMNEFAKSEKIYADMNTFSAGNDAVGKDTQNILSQLHDSLAAVIDRNEFSIEDKYDALRNTLQKNVLASGADPFAIKKAYEDYGKALRNLSSQTTGNLADDLLNESVFYSTGQYRGSEKDTFYSDQSGNTTTFNGQNERVWVQAAFSDASGINKASLENYIDIFGKTVSRGLAGEAGIAVPTQFGDVTVPKWTASGIRIKDPITGENNVYQMISLRDQTTRDIGFISIVDTGRGLTIVGGQVIDKANGIVRMFSQKDLLTRLSGSGITIDNIKSKITALGADMFLVLNGIGSGIALAGNNTTLTGLRTGQFNLDASTGLGTLTGTERAAAVDKYVKDLVASGDLKNFQIPNPFDYRAGERVGASLTMKDANGNWVDASSFFSPDIVAAIIGEKTKEYSPNGIPTGPLGPLGGPGNNLGSGRKLVMPGTITTPANPMLRAEYSTPTTPPARPPITKADTTLATGTPVLAAQKPLAENAAPPIAKITPPAALTTPAIAPASVAAIKPAEAAALTAFRAGERASLTSASTTLGGFFRNSPFKVAL